MTSKLKTDVLETGSGSGTIALNNQLSGMTAESMPSGSVLQVVSTTKTDTFSTTSTSFIDVTGVTATITPSSTSSKILVTLTTVYSASATGYGAVVRVLRGSTPIGGGTASGNRPSSFSSQTFKDIETAESAGFNYLDSPATTSATTYKLQALVRSSQTVYFGRTANDRNDIFMGRTSSTITLTEIKG